MRIPEPFFAIINPTVRVLLRSPIHGLWSKSLMLITFTGRKTQRVYTTPIRYLQRGDAVWAFTSADTNWWRNLKGGATVSLRIRGKDGRYRAEAIADAPGQVPATPFEYFFRIFHKMRRTTISARGRIAVHPRAIWTRRQQRRFGSKLTHRMEAPNTRLDTAALRPAVSGRSIATRWTTQFVQVE